MNISLIRPILPPHITTSEYGWRWIQAWEDKPGHETKIINGQKYNDFHTGVDYVNADDDRRVVAIADGIIVKDFDNYDHSKRWTNIEHSVGNYFLVQHKDENGKLFHAIYYHIGENYVSIEQEVVQGEVLGVYADVGKAFGAHLHFELLDENQRQFNFIDFYIQGLKNAGLI